MSCYICESATTSADSFKCEGICDRQMHAACVGISKSLCKAYMQMSNLYYLCDECVDSSIKGINMKLDKLMSFLNSYEERLTTNENNMLDILKVTDEIKNSISENRKSVSYSDIVKKDKTQKSKSKKDAVVIVKPKAKQKGEKTEIDFKNSIDPSQVKVNKLRKGPKGGLAIVCENEDASKQLQDIVSEKLGENYVVRPQLNTASKLKIVGISDDLNDNDIISALKKQNEFLSDKEIKVMKSYKVKHSRSMSAIIEVDSVTAEKCLSEKLLKIGWSRCRVFEASSLYRCFKCQGYMHKADNCKNVKSCSKCAGNHDIKECDANFEKCINCTSANEKFSLKLEVNHCVSSLKCPVYTKKVRAFKNKIHFEE